MAQTKRNEEKVVDETLKMRGNFYGYAKIKTVCFVKYLGSMMTDFDKTSITGVLVDETIRVRGNNSILTLKLHCFVKYLDSMLMDFHKTSVTVKLLMRQLK